MASSNLNGVSLLEQVGAAYALVGSRVTCEPAPTDTDQDVLVFADLPTLENLLPLLVGHGFKLDGSDLRDPKDHLGDKNTFQSFSDGEVNFIITSDVEFYRKFIAATSVAKRLNLLEKSDRIALFQAVLYGNPTAGKEQEYCNGIL